MGDEAQPIAVQTEDGSVVRLTQAGRALRHGIEHGLHVGRRLADHPQDLAGRCFPSQRLRQTLL